VLRLAYAIGSPILAVHYWAHRAIDLIAGRTQVSGGTLLAGMPQIRTRKLEPGRLRQ
jgi:hypothetical protein